MATPTALALFDEGHEVELTVNQNPSILAVAEFPTDLCIVYIRI